MLSGDVQIGVYAFCSQCPCFPVHHRVMVPPDRMFDLVAVEDTPYLEPIIDQKFVHLDLGFECPKRPNSGS